MAQPLGRQLGHSIKSQRNSAHLLPSHAPRDLPKWVENLCPHRKLTACNCFFFIKSLHWKPLRCSSRTGWVIRTSYNRALLSSRKKWAIRPRRDSDKPQVCISKWKKSVWKGHIPCDSDMTLRKRQVCRDGEKTMVGRASRSRFWIDKAQGNFRAVKLLYVVL